MTTVLLIRHGRTTANSTGVLAGRTPGVGLDETGVQQAREVGGRIATIPLRALVTSPLRRCRQTTQALVTARGDGCPVSVEQGLIECGYGEWTGRSLRDLSKEKLWQTVQQQPSAVRFPAGESMTEMSARAIGTVRGWDQRLADTVGDDAVWAAVSHGDVIKAVLADALGMHLDAFQRIIVDPASVSVIRYTATRPYVLTMNSQTAELATFFRQPAKKKTSRARTRKAADDAPIGGGMGAEEVVEA
ncbi:histidine phosphatase family protein [Microlunatus panaciterrae]|uniref:2,3-bisphosphoglycerate-dependent phosphoglycerate mutase n=1 Tax=Microlunatus panaciterrae TaxID=400768 RepID=A0ABS2RN63_9ACTN|nr:MSMEG_4193 family putative phosphomutase [Microlunatus panaciterrae]MBM7800430.1 2,3-bisphosphoglycerate-dependent phosphoglycerate mutase [Microlunatus panaciterrae]